MGLTIPRLYSYALSLSILLGWMIQAWILIHPSIHGYIEFTCWQLAYRFVPLFFFNHCIRRTLEVEWSLPFEDVMIEIEGELYVELSTYAF